MPEPGRGWHQAGDDELADAGRLARAWADDASLLLAPARRGVDAAWFAAALARLPSELARDHVALLTSGSTGAPRLVIGRKARAVALAHQLHRRQELEDVERTVTLLPLGYSYAFVNQLVWARVHDRAIVVSPGLADGAATRALLRDGPDTMICLVGPMLALLARQLAPGEALRAVTRVNFAGGPFPWAERDTLARVFPRARVFGNYGCAEAMPRLCVAPAEALTGPGELGPALAGVELRVDEAGELRFRSPYAAVGLLEGDAYRAVAPDEWLGTSDLARDEGGGRFRLLGRKSEIYKRYGEKVSVAQQLDAVRQAWRGDVAAFLERDAAGEPGHVLVLAPAPGPDEVRAVLKVFRAGFPRSHWPLRLDSVAALPLSANGKPDAAALAAGPRHTHWHLPL